LVPDAVLIDAQHPFGALALKPIRRRLDGTGCQEIVALPVFVRVLNEGGQHHPGPELELGASLIDAGRAVRNAEEVAK